MNTATMCSFGECHPGCGSTFENMVITQNLHYSATKKKARGTTCGTIGAGYNVFSNPDATCPVITKKIKFNERLNSALYFDFYNVLNHMQAADPCF